MSTLMRLLGIHEIGNWGGCPSSLINLPNKGIASLVAGIVSARTCENTVSDSRIVTPEIGTNVDVSKM